MNRPQDDGWRIHPLVPETLRTMLPRDAKVVELGGGTGSPYLHHIFPNAVTIEHAQTWADYLQGMGLAYMHIPLSGGWYKETDELLAALAGADCIIVDGPPARRRINVRSRLIHFPPDCVVVFDDSQRLQLAELIDQLVEDGGWLPLEGVRDGKRQTTILRTPSDD